MLQTMAAFVSERARMMDRREIVEILTLVVATVAGLVFMTSIARTLAGALAWMLVAVQ